MRYLLTWLVLLWPAIAAGQIVVPETVEDHEPIVAALADNELPEGAEVKGGWSTTGKLLPTGDRCVVHLWAPPGKHTVSFRGAWATTREITIDGETFPVLTGWGFLDYTAPFEVKPDGDDPPPPPPPPRNAVGVVVEESASRTPDRASLWLALRASTLAPRLLILDQDQMKGPGLTRVLQAVREANLRLPALAVCEGDCSDVDKLVVVSVKPAPGTVAEFKDELP